jgi:hypothetical protein
MSEQPDTTESVLKWGGTIDAATCVDRSSTCMTGILQHLICPWEGCCTWACDTIAGAARPFLQCTADEMRSDDGV